MGQHALVHTLDAFMKNIVVLTLDHGIILIVNYRKKFDTISRKNKKNLSDRIVLVHSTREIVLPQDEKKSKKIFCFPLYIQTSPSMIFMDAHPDIYFNVWYVLIL